MHVRHASAFLLSARVVVGVHVGMRVHAVAAGHTIVLEQDGWTSEGQAGRDYW